MLCWLGDGGVFWPPAHPDGPDLCPVPVPVWGQSEVPARLSVWRLCSQCLHVPHKCTNERGCLRVRTIYFLKVHTRTVISFLGCTLYTVGCRVWVNILCENYKELDDCINFCFRESQRKTSGQSTGSSNDLQLQDGSPLMGRNGILWNLGHWVKKKKIRNRFFIKNIYFYI